jgi:hypothetical protein
MSDKGNTARRDAIATGVNIAVDAVAAEVTSAFREVGIRALLLKGPPSVRWLYDSYSGRFSTDVDLLIEPGSRSAAEQVLEQLLFRPLPQNIGPDEPRHAQAWERDGNPVDVDLHVSVAGAGAPVDEVWRVLSRETEQIVLAGAPVEVPAASARALLLALHAAQHGANWEQALRDLERALARLPDEAWRMAAALAGELDATPSFAAGLELVEGGEALADRLELPKQRTVEATLRAWTAPDLTLGIHRLTTTRGLRAKGAFVVRKVFPSPAWMRRWVPLARRGRLGLGAAYAVRPVSLVLRMPRALRAWRRARSESRRSAG